MPAMIPLQTQEQFETLYSKDYKLEEPILIYFTASWCGACKRLDWDFLKEEFPNLNVYKCDVDENKYTPGYCGVRSIPSFVFMPPNKQLQTLQSSETAKVAAWISKNLIQGEKK
jgi:thioredoxin-like negative regulator of GroEL